MSTITVKISSKTRSGKYLSDLLHELARTGKDIKIEHVPNAETIEAINEARQRKGTKVESIDDLFDKLNS
jgi:antitoxin component of RelBE/YafQ-DinJ toxin-antitoxin module